MIGKLICWMFLNVCQINVDKRIVAAGIRFRILGQFILRSIFYHGRWLITAEL